MTPAESFAAIRSGGMQEVFAFGEYRVDTASTRVWRGHTLLELPSRAVDTLVLLIRHRQRTVGKSELVTSIWNDVAVTDDSLIHVISVLRRALGDDSRNPKYIRTIPRRGYRFVAAVSVVDSAWELSARTQSRAVDGGRTTRASRHPAGTAVSVMSFGALGIAALVLAFAVTRNDEAPTAATNAASGTIRFNQASPPGTSILSGGALSPDSRHIAFVARDNNSGKAALWVRTLATGELRKLPGTRGASKPFWAPDGRRIAFFADSRLLATSLSSEQPQEIAAVSLTPAGGTWGPDDTILYSEWASGIYSVPASGGAAATSVLRLDHAARDIAITRPQILPDGRHFIFHRVNFDAARTGTYLGDLVTRESHRLLDTKTPAVFAPNGHLLHVRADMLIAERFDTQRLELTGEARIIARGVAAPTLDADNMVSASASLLSFRNGSKHQSLSWISRNGEAVLGLKMPTVIYNPRLSPDQSQLLATGSITADPGLWLASASREEFARLEADAIAPLWAPDGHRIAFTSRGGFDLIVRSMDGRGEKRRLLSDSAVKILNDWSPDGKQIVFTMSGPDTGLDLWTTGLGDGAASPLLATPSNEMQARFSPDGRWIAYASDETGALEVYVRSYPDAGEKRMVSADGGGQPQWRADQQELFYISADRTIMSVEVTAGSHGIGFGEPQQLFRAPLLGDAEDARDHYVVSTDGKRFLIDGSGEPDGAAEITIIVNWSELSAERPDDSTTISAPITQFL